IRPRVQRYLRRLARPIGLAWVAPKNGSAAGERQSISSWRPALSLRPSRPTYTGSGLSAPTMRPRHRSRPKRRRVRRRAVSRWISMSRSIASWPMPPGALRPASRRPDRSAIDCSRLSAMAAKCRSSPAISAGSALAERRSGRSNALVVSEFTSAPMASSVSRAVAASGSAASPLAPCHTGRSGPGSERVREPLVGTLSYPGDVPVGPDQHGSGGGDRAKDRKLPRAGVFGVDQLGPLRPGGDVEGAGPAEVEYHRPGVVQQGEYPQRAAGGDQVEVGHVAPEQRVSRTEVVVNVQAGDHRGDPRAGLVQAQQLGHGVAQRAGPRVAAGERG